MLQNTDLNDVEHCAAVASSPSLTEILARRVVERSTADKQAELAGEMRRIIDSTYDLVERTGNLDPSMREILSHSGLSTQSFYRCFQSKDELLLALLDDGRRRLVGYLEIRMGRFRSPKEKVRAWIEGVLAQASEPHAAARTRPFFANEDRLAEMFPAEHTASVDLLVSLLVEPISRLRERSAGTAAGARAAASARRDAEAVYRLTFATLHDHLLRRTKPSSSAVAHLVAFALGGIGGTN
jgi:AcrR family transcriptional regulator